MQPKSNALTDTSACFDSGECGHANRVVDLVLERLPSGEFAYLGPSIAEPRFTITDAGRHALRMTELFASSK